MSRPLPTTLVLAFYGDDFTGSSSVMEVLSAVGLETVLFLQQPTDHQLKAFSKARCIGIAGVSRSRSPTWMDANLPSLYAGLKALNPALIHYKTCSTFDSSPTLGSIGRAIDVFGAQDWIPLMVAAPAIGRFQVFGNLFARVGEETYRLDRHPVMAHHPVTPMDEADLQRHLAKQTTKAIGLIDVNALNAGQTKAALQAEIAKDKQIISLDTLDETHLVEVGRLIWEEQASFAVGSQGVEYALVAYWLAAGLLPTPHPLPYAPAVKQIIAVSGSLSPITAAQIDHAAQHAFTLVAIDAAKPDWQSAYDVAVKILNEGQSPLIFTAKGHETAQKLAAKENDALGAGLGKLLNRLLAQTKITRIAIAGGDTSSHAVSAMGVYALTMLAPLQAGAPLCRAFHEGDEPFELVLKGGQMGQKDFFKAVRDGQ